MATRKAAKANPRKIANMWRFKGDTGGSTIRFWAPK